MHARNVERGFDRATRVYFASLIRAHGIRAAGRKSEIPVSTTTLGKVAREFGIELPAGKRPYALISLPSPALTLAQKQELANILSRDARECGFTSDEWTTRRIREVIRRMFSIDCHPFHLRALLEDVTASV